VRQWPNCLGADLNTGRGGAGGALWRYLRGARGKVTAKSSYSFVTICKALRCQNAADKPRIPLTSPEYR
jgi:hypothetical protein